VEIAGAAVPVSEIASADGFSATHHPIGILLAAELPRLPAWEGEQLSGADSDRVERLRSMGYLE
jgi:hypothetical protein